jgi:aryl-alcohol dehydrogenase-like predicted oxidoreductase
MRYRTLGKTSIRVSEVGFGCWTMGGPNWSSDSGKAIGWAGVTEEEILAGIKAGLDAGVNHWDNADVYGNGRAERLLGSCLRRLGVGKGPAREGQVIATKVGHFRGTGAHAYEPAQIRHQCETSLRNLGVEHIDLYYFHHGTFTGQDFSGREHDYLQEAAATMHALVKEGKVRAVGQSAYSDDDFERVVPVVKPDVLQNKANLRYDPFIRPGSRCQALMDRYGCSYVAFGPLDQGILLDKFDPANPPKFDEGDYRANRKDFAAGTLAGVREKLAKVRARFCPGAQGEEAVAALASVACRWVLAHPHVCSTIPGFRNARQAAANVRAGADEPLAEGDVRWLRELFQDEGEGKMAGV